MSDLNRIMGTLGILCALFSIAAPTAEAQTARRYDADQVRRARQSLLHTRTARRVLQEAPIGYRIPHERVRQASAEVPIEPLPFESSYRSESMPPEFSYADDAVIEDGETSGQFGHWDGGWDGDPVMDDGGCCDDGGCTSCTSPYGFDGTMAFGGPILNLRNASIFAGVQGFTGPFNLQGSGSFGFHQGVNIGIPLAIFPMSGMGMQLGFRTIQSNLSGSDFTNDQRNQAFYTIGGFRRTQCGIQGGLVVDFLRDSWYDKISVNQLRGQISWKFPERHEWGYWFTAAGSDDTTMSPIVPGQVDIWSQTSLHAFFYRRRMELVPGGLLSLFAGFSGEQDGLIGTNAFLPINEFLAFQTDFAYLTPSQPTNLGGTLNESWNIGLSLVWRLGLNAQCPESRFSPIFDVADNGSFMVDRDGVRPAQDGQ